MRAVFLDRDGTINVDTGYVYRTEDFRFTDRAPEAIRILNDAGFKVIVISNQSGVGRGFYTIEDVHTLHAHIDAELKKHGAKIDAYYVCPHAPEDFCDCRKPKPEMVLRAAERFGIDLSESWLIGDKPIDAQCAVNAGVRPVLIRSDYGGAECPVFDGLYECVRFCVRDSF